MLQTFSSKESREFKPVQLNNSARIYDKRGTNFLAFGKPEMKPEVIEYQKADLSEYTAKSAQAPLQIKNLKDMPVLDNTFGKPGVFEFRYGDIANPVAYGDDYNMDFGGKDPTALGFFGKTERQVADYLKRDRDFTDRYNNLKPKMYGENMAGAAEKPELSKFDPLKAYSTYGYRESSDWVKKEGFVANSMAMNLKKKEKATYVMDIDRNMCPAGSVTVHGFCIPVGYNESYCPEGYRYSETHGCQPIVSSGEKQQAECLPGWEFKNGMCKVKELSTAEPVQEYNCTYTMGILLGVIIIFGLGAIASKAFQSDNKPRI